MPLVTPFPRCVVASRRAFGRNSEQVAERPEVEIEIALIESEVLGQLLHALLELHERLAETLDLLVVQVPRLHAAKRLAFHELPQQLDQGEHELREPALDVLGIGLDAPRQRAPRAFEVTCKRLEVAAREQQPVDGVGHAAARSRSRTAKLYGGHGPVHANESSRWRCRASS